MSRQYAVDPIKLAEGLGLTPEERDICLTAGDHPYNCRCDTCKSWWKAVGPDPDTGRCGPWTMEELGLDPKDWAWVFEEPPEGYSDRGVREGETP